MWWAGGFSTYLEPMLLPSDTYVLFLNGNFIIQIIVIQLISAQYCSLSLLLFPPFPPQLFFLSISTLDFDGTEPCALQAAHFDSAHPPPTRLCLQFWAGDPTSGIKGDGQADPQLVATLGPCGDKGRGEMSSLRCQVLCSPLCSWRVALFLFCYVW